MVHPEPLVDIKSGVIRLKNTNSFEVRICVDYCPSWIYLESDQFIIPRKKTCNINFAVNWELFTEQNALILSFRENFSKELLKQPLNAAHRRCAVCRMLFNPKNNPSGYCDHSGDWHSSTVQCGIRCSAIGLSNFGNSHWSCCWSCDKDSPCSKSGPHSEKICNYVFLRFM